MEYLAPPLKMLLHVQLKIKSGISVQSAIQSYVQDNLDCPLAKQTEFWLFCHQTGKTFNTKELSKKIYRRALIDIFERGLKGEPILSILQEFQEELKDISKQNLDQQIQKLPFLTLIPLFVFQVPAFLLLLLGPILLNLSSQL